MIFSLFIFYVLHLLISPCCIWPLSPAPCCLLTFKRCFLLATINLAISLLYALTPPAACNCCHGSNHATALALTAQLGGSMLWNSRSSIWTLIAPLLNIALSLAIPLTFAEHHPTHGKGGQGGFRSLCTWWCLLPSYFLPRRAAVNHGGKENLEKARNNQCHWHLVNLGSDPKRHKTLIKWCLCNPFWNRPHNTHPTPAPAAMPVLSVKRSWRTQKLRVWCFLCK